MSSLPVFHLLLAVVFITACNGQSNQNALEATAPEARVAPLPDAQIDDYVVEIFEDKKGNLWFGTMAKGAARFDGKTLTYFTKAEGLCDNTVVCIMEDREGNMWFGTHNGASK